MAREMKDSGIEWIGEMPNDWRLPKAGFVFSIGRGRVIAKTELDEKSLYPVYSSQTKNSGILGYIDTFDFENDQLTWTTDGANAGTVFLRKGKHNCTNICGTLLPKVKNLNLEYLKYSIDYVNFHNRRADTNGYKIMNNEMAAIKFPLPPLETQNKIACFLDEKFIEIDNIIEQTKRSIEEYKKYKQSLITEVVTKGLDKNVEMKDSGIDWIGEIPEHWDLVKLKYLFEVRKRISGELGHDVLSVTQKGLKIKNIESNEGQLSADYSKYQFVNKNDYVMNHMDLLTGWVDLSVFDGVTSPDYRVFAMKYNLNHSKEFYKLIFQMCYTNKIFYGMGQGVSNLGRWRLQTDKFINTPLPVPPCEEQEKIAKFVLNKMSDIEEFVLRKASLIMELESYKKSLIYEVVTGKKEVV